MRALNALIRNVFKPRLAATPTPLEARKDFARTARLVFRRPPYLLRRVSPGRPDLHWVTAGPAARQGVILFLHGGAYIGGSPMTHAALAGRISRLTGCAVALPDYRLAPEHPAPAAFDDARAAHARLMTLGLAPQEIALVGDSSGGGLALALLADLCARGRRPAAVATFSAWTDLALGSASLSTNADADPMLPVSRIEETVGFVKGSLAPDDPRLSPVHARFEAPPPAMLFVGTTEILRDDTLRMAAHLRHSGGVVTVRDYAEAPHAWPILDGYFPEARAALAEVDGFLMQHLPSEAPFRPPARS